MVGVALGGLGVVSLRLPFTLWSTSTHVLDLPSVVLTICLVAFFAFIAYLTNPNEASFRAFLTELVFRQHLSRLSEAHNSIDSDDLDDDSPSRQSTSDDEPHRTRKLSNHRLNATSSSDTAVPTVFHFANKASVSLRTPSYDFRSFLVVTFAVVPPVEMAMIPLIPPSSHTNHHSISTSPKPIFWNNPHTRGSCFIGAFGRWWQAFEMNMQPRQVKLAAQNDASVSSRLRPGSGGDDNHVTLDSSLFASSSRHEDLSGRTSVKPQQPGTAIPRRSSGSSRANTKGLIREKNSIQSLPKRDAVLPTNLPPRPTTPPPLPKSASLPLHAKRIPSSPEQHKQPRNAPPSLISSTCNPASSTVCQPSQQGLSTVPDQSPIITDLLEQLDAARSAASDLQSQLTHARAASASTTASLEAEVAQARATKKSEDTARAALKTRTKSLDDTRRHADSTKREAEKRLRSAETQRDHANDLIERLGTAVENMKRAMEEEVVRVEEKRVSDADKRAALTAEIATRKEELKEAEAQVQILAARARVLETVVAEEKTKFEKLEEIRDKQIKDQEDNASKSPSLSSAWPPRLSPEHSPETVGLLPSVFSGGLPIHRPAQQLLQSQAHPPGNLSVAIAPSTQFRPFGPGSSSPVSPAPRPSPLSPISTSLIPSSLMQSMDIPSLHGQTITESEVPSSPVDSPTSSGGGGGGGGMNPIYEEPFTIIDLREEALPTPNHIRFDDTSFVPPSVTSGNTASKLLQRPKSPSPSTVTVPSLNNAASTRRRWFGLKERGLNPDAKVFTLPNQGSAFTSTIGAQSNHIPANLISGNNAMGNTALGTSLVSGFGKIGVGNVHTDGRPTLRMASEFGPIGSTPTSSSPDFFQHPRSSLSAPSLQDSLFNHPNHTGHLSLRDTSSPPSRSTAAVHVAPLPVPSFPSDGGFFSTLQNAFAPSPEERVALFRALGRGTNSANTSREKVSGLPTIGSSGSSSMSSSAPLSSSGSGSSGAMSASSSGPGATSGSPNGSYRATNSITNPPPRWNGTIVHMPITAHGHTHIHGLPHSSHTHSANSISRSQTHRSAFDPWAGEGKSDS